MKKISQTEFVEEFVRRRPVYDCFTLKVKQLLESLVKLQSIKIHIIEARTKTVESFRDKITRPEKNYDRPLEQISDISGVRIILYYLDDLEKVETCLRANFSIIEKESQNKQKSYSPHEFGYMSYHFVLHLNSARSKLPEWKDYKGLKAEVQVRTVLQHSWAAISHALQYKREGDVPTELRRKLFRLAGLFELADEQFVELKVAHETLREKRVRSFKELKGKTKLDQITVREFLDSWDKVSELRNSLKDYGFDFDYENGIDFVPEIVEESNRLGIDTIEELQNSISFDYKPFLTGITDVRGWDVSISFVVYLLLIKSNINNFSLEYLQKMGWTKDIAITVLAVANKTT